MRIKLPNTDFHFNDHNENSLALGTVFYVLILMTITIIGTMFVTWDFPFYTLRLIGFVIIILYVLGIVNYHILNSNKGSK